MSCSAFFHRWPRESTATRSCPESLCTLELLRLGLEVIHMQSQHSDVVLDPWGVPPVISLLCEHLDQVLAAAEDLTSLKLVPGRGAEYSQASGSEADQDQDADGEDARDPQTINSFVRDVQRLELAVAMRALRAREYARELKRTDARFKTIADLFLGGTNPLADALEALAQPGGDAFETGQDPVGYLQARGVIPDDVAAHSETDVTEISEDFRLGGVVEVGPLMDLVASFLDAIEIHYDVFPDTGETAPANPTDERRTSAPQLAA